MSTTSFVLQHLSDLCRVCLQLPEETQYLDLTTIYDEEENLTYGECFAICTHIDLNAGVGIPHHLCKSCGLELQMSYDFHKKVEESKRILQQCQRQMKENISTAVDVLSTTEKEEKLKSDTVEEVDVTLIANKYVISDFEEDTASAVQESALQHESEFVPALDVEEETENNNSNQICEVKDVQQVEVEQEDITNLEPMNASDSADIEEHLEIEDYQNLEALEEEETETLQMKCSKNISPVALIKYKCNEYEEHEEYVEFKEEEEEQEVEEITEYENYSQETNEDNDDNVTWQEIVVAVANKEHLPVETEGEREANDDNVIMCDSSQDEGNNNNADEDDVESKWEGYKKNNARNNTRKRHVGSYTCDYCQRVYPNYSRMMSHRRCHEADRPKFSCSYCGRMYATKQAMECHIQTAHEKSGYTCSICSKVFAIRKSLEIHIRYHTGDFPYACKQCDRKFAQACHLNTHVNVKHNRIRFSCDYPDCGKFFTSSTSLRNHEYSHGIMPFECDYCQQGYPAKAKLRIHIKRKHGMDLNKDQLEHMRKFHVMRSKVNIVQFVEP